MIELKDAYEILGVKEGASKDEIIKRYDILLRKMRMIGQADPEDPKPDIAEINRAYNLLMGYDDGSAQESEENRNTLTGQMLSKAGIDEKKARNFFYYYKYHILASLAGILILVYIVSSFVNRVDPDLNLVIAGKFSLTQTEELKNTIQEKLTGTKELGTDFLFLSEDGMSQQDQAYTMKFVTLMAAGDVDVYILGRVNFEKYGTKGAFASLDGLADQLGIDRDKNSKQVLMDSETNEEHLYGIDVTGSPLLKGIEPVDSEKIAVLRVKAKNYDRALELLKQLGS